MGHTVPHTLIRLGRDMHGTHLGGSLWNASNLPQAGLDSQNPGRVSDKFPHCVSDAMHGTILLELAAWAEHWLFASVSIVVGVVHENTGCLIW